MTFTPVPDVVYMVVQERKEAAAPSGKRLFRLNRTGDAQKKRVIVSHALSWVERVIGLDQLDEIYDRVSQGGEGSFIDRSLNALEVALTVGRSELLRIPTTGPLVVVANHPFGAIEGMLLAELIRRVRPDVKVIANFLLSRIPELHDSFLFVDPFGGEGAARANLGAVRQAMRWVQQGGALAMFPAGEVAHLDMRRREILEPSWNSSVTRIVLKTQAPVLPIFFDGHNGPLFQALGLVHPRLRTALLPRELLNKRGRRLTARIGTPINWKKLSGIGGEQEMTDYLRQRTLMLRYRPPEATAALEVETPVTAGNVAPRGGSDTTFSDRPLALAGPVEAYAAEVAALPEDQLLVDSEGFRVYRATAGQVPNLLQEIGRLREITYRAAGEGTGKPLDLDKFDQWYEHLFVWNSATREVVGAYRLGRSDEILPARGVKGLYTQTLFSFRSNLLERLGPALELGRSFVRADYQRSYAALMLLWKGIGRYVCLFPRYRVLFGPVSISNDYQSVSRQLMVEFLEHHHAAHSLSPLARPRNPFRHAQIHGCDREEMRDLLRESENLGDLVAQIEPDQKGIPVLLRQYLKLGAKFFAFNVDADFNDAVDALMYVDLTQTDGKTLDRYLTPEGARAFLAYHGARRAPRRGSTEALCN